MIETITSLNKILNSFNIKAECVDVHSHRHFVNYNLKLQLGAKINNLSKSLQEIGLALKSKNIPIIKIIPEQGVIQLQCSYGMSEILDLQKLLEKGIIPPGIMPFLLGETDDGKQMWIDFGKLPHLLIGGCTGSGKSCLLQNILYNAARTKNVKLYLIDSKQIEFNCYDNNKYSKLIVNVAKNYTSAVNILKYLCDLMEARYLHLAKIGVSNLEIYPSILDKILVVIDEVADLILQDKSHIFQDSLIRLSSKSRAANIFVVCATQRPSTDIIYGGIKSNFSARCSLRMASRVDSQVILDSAGAECLSNKGEALFKSSDVSLTRFQIGYIEQKNIIKMLSQN